MESPHYVYHGAHDKTVQDHLQILRSLVLRRLTPIYIGDAVQVSNRWADKTPNPDTGKTGIVTDLSCGIQSIFNEEYLIYTIQPPVGNPFQSYHYTLDRTRQSPSNQLLEKLLNGG